MVTFSVYTHILNVLYNIDIFKYFMFFVMTNMKVRINHLDISDSPFNKDNENTFIFENEENTLQIVQELVYGNPTCFLEASPIHIELTRSAFINLYLSCHTLYSISFILLSIGI